MADHQYSRALSDLEVGKAEAIRDVMDAETFTALLASLFSNPRDPDRHVYFIGVEGNGPIKIGYAKGVLARLAMLRRETGQDLSILALTQGGKPLEFAYHVKFERHRLHGEWFERCPQIEAEIAHLNTLPGHHTALEMRYG